MLRNIKANISGIGLIPFGTLLNFLLAPTFPLLNGSKFEFDWLENTYNDKMNNLNSIDFAKSDSLVDNDFMIGRFN